MDLSQHKKRDEEKQRYELKFGGNLEKAEEERAALHYLPLTTDEMKAIRKKTPTPKHSDPVKAAEARNEAIVMRVLKERIVPPFENLHAEPGKPITSSEQLLKVIGELKAGPGAELVNELFEVITDGAEIEETARKN